MHPQFNRKELVEKLLKTYPIEDLAILTDNQLYKLYGHTFLIIHSNSYYSNFYSL
jgi:hypothetical protein